MSDLLIVATKTANLEGLKVKLGQAGYAFRQFEGLPRFFIIDNETPDGFRLKDDADIKRWCPADAKMALQSVDQPASIGVKLAEGWGLARICRRRPPWDKRRVTHPVDTFYRYTRTGQGVDIYIIDSGVRITHEDFGGRAFKVTDSRYGDDIGHGTACASFAAGAQSGVAKEATVWDVRVADFVTNDLTVASTVQGYSYVMTHYASRANTNRPAIISNSVGGTQTPGSDEDLMWREALADVIDAGIPCFLPAGNNRMDLSQVLYEPAEGDPDAVIVAGSAMNDTPYLFGSSGTNYGANDVDIVAPSQIVRHAENTADTTYTTGSGTSYGTPYTAGVAACMLQGYGRLRNRADVQALKTQLLANATQGELVSAYGYDLPDRLLYIDPDIAFEVIPGLEDLIL